jgi:hypothetical protein
MPTLEQTWGMLCEVPDERPPRAPGNFEQRTSVSEIQEFLKCPRKWALHRLAGVPRIKGEALRFGIALHWSLAEYIRDRASWGEKVKPESKIGLLTQGMARCVRILPGDEVLVEPEWVLPMNEIETDVYVKPDLVVRRNGILTVPDWKSTSAESARHVWALQGLNLWHVSQPEADSGEHAAKLPVGAKTLWNDVQPRIYLWGTQRIFNAPSGTAQWVYGSKSFKPPANPRTWSVIETMSAPAVERWIKKYIHPTVALMNRLRQAYAAGEIDSPLLIPHRGEGCEFVGKFCDAIGQCQLKKSPIDAEDFRRHLPVIPA